MSDTNYINKIIKKRITWTLGLIISAVLIVYLLYAFTFQPNKGKNGFNRLIGPGTATIKASLTRLKNLGQLCGTTPYHIYIETEDKKVLLQADWGLKNIDTLRFDLPDSRKILSRVSYQVDSPFVTIFAGNGPVVFAGTVNSSKLNSYKYKYPLFVRSASLGNDNFAFRAFDTARKPGQVFVLWNASSGRIRKMADPLEKSTDLGMGSDGLLQYDSTLHILVYIEYYKDRFITLDTDLNTIYKGESIDTIHVGRTAGGNYNKSSWTFFTNKSPGFIVNWIACTEGGTLYINSRLRADNEREDAFRDNLVFDQYSLATGKYLSSFYVPNPGKEGPTSVKVEGERMVVAFADAIYSYSLR